MLFKIFAGKKKKNLLSIAEPTVTGKKKTNVRGVGGRQRGLGTRLTLPYMKKFTLNISFSAMDSRFFFFFLEHHE